MSDRIKLGEPLVNPKIGDLVRFPLWDIDKCSKVIDVAILHDMKCILLETISSQGLRGTAWYQSALFEKINIELKQLTSKEVSIKMINISEALLAKENKND